MKTLLNILVKAKSRRTRKNAKTTVEAAHGLRNIYHINKLNGNVTFID